MKLNSVITLAILLFMICPWAIWTHGQNFTTVSNKTMNVDGTLVSGVIVQMDLDACNYDTTEIFFKRYLGSSPVDLCYDSMGIAYVAAIRYIIKFDSIFSNQTIVDTFWNAPFNGHVHCVKMFTDSSLIICTRDVIFEYYLNSKTSRILVYPPDGSHPQRPGRNLTFRNGKLYYISGFNYIFELDPFKPEIIRMFDSIPDQTLIKGIAMDVKSCDSIDYYIHDDGVTQPNKVRKYDFETKSLSTLCLHDHNYHGFASPTEYLGVNCHFFIDLDEDDSYGPYDWETNAGLVCGDEQHYLLDDPWIRSFGDIDSLQVAVVNPPDGNAEWLYADDHPTVEVDRLTPYHIMLRNQGRCYP